MMFVVVGVYFVLMLTIGWWAVDYSLMTWFAHDIIWIGDIVIALCLGSLAIPLAIISLVLELFGVPTPFIQ